MAVKAAREVSESEVFAARHRTIRALRLAQAFRAAGFTVEQVNEAGPYAWTLASAFVGLTTAPSRATQAAALVLLAEDGL